MDTLIIFVGSKPYDSSFTAVISVGISKAVPVLYLYTAIYLT